MLRRSLGGGVALAVLALGCPECAPPGGDASNAVPPGPVAPGDIDGGEGEDVAGEGEGEAAGCVAGSRRCTDLVLEICGNDGTFVALETCASSCAAALGCVACEPGSARCDGATSTICRSDGTVEVEHCDPVQDLTCDAGTGRCAGACSLEAIGQSYIGCEYFPTITANSVDAAFHFAVVVSNTKPDQATITIEGGALAEPEVLTVAGDSVAVHTLPWTDTKYWSTAYYAPRSAYRLRSTRPVTVYQFNPLEFSLPDTAPDGWPSARYSMTNDASLLLPRNALGSEYVAAAWGPDSEAAYPVSPGIFAITAVDDDTNVTVTARSAVEAGIGVPPFPAGEPRTLTLHRGDVLQLYGHSGDLTGSLVNADKPVQVIGGHYCTFIPASACCCDHIEESIFPVRALGRRYFVTAPAVPGLVAPTSHGVRVIATRAATTVTVIDQQGAGQPLALDAVGDVVDLPLGGGDLELVSDQPLLVAQYMLSQDAGAGSGDPSMTLAVPVEQYRMEYLLHAPTNYLDSYVNVVAPMGSSIVIDGAPAGALAAIGTGELGVVRVALDDGPNGDGSHTVSADAPVGVTAYGYAPYTSYFYPAGLDLKPTD